MATVLRRTWSRRAGARYAASQERDAEESGELELSKFAAAIRPTDTVVDFGCGPGALLARLNARIKIGVEVNAAAKEAAERRGVTVVASTAELEDGWADVVISNHALEHTLRPYDELCELRRALRVGGRLLLWLPLDDWRAQRTQRG